jgi:heat shock protein HtpX
MNANILKTTLFLGLLTSLFLLVGYWLGGQTGMFFAFVIAIIMNFSAYWFSDTMVLKWYKAQQISSADPSGLYQVVAELAKKANMPMPKVYIVDSDMPNAFATGRYPEHASVAATTGILTILNKQELTGVMAHELCHVLHRDTLISAISATVAGAISMLANFFMFSSLFGERDNDSPLGTIGAILLLLLAPIAAGLIQMAISRSCEYHADQGGALLSEHPEWLASALKKLDAASQHSSMPQAEQNPATAHMFIVNPLHGGQLASLFATHPPMAERIKRLNAMMQNQST